LFSSFSRFRYNRTEIADVDAVFDQDVNGYKAQTLWNNDSTSGNYMFKVWAVDKEGFISEPSVTV
jgi:hypothetical protein